jgi:hypothetical protein
VASAAAGSRRRWVAETDWQSGHEARWALNLPERVRGLIDTHNTYALRPAGAAITHAG